MLIIPYVLVQDIFFLHMSRCYIVIGFKRLYRHIDFHAFRGEVYQLGKNE